jgi:hypothetical protein
MNKRKIVIIIVILTIGVGLFMIYPFFVPKNPKIIDNIILEYNCYHPRTVDKEAFKEYYRIYQSGEVEYSTNIEEKCNKNVVLEPFTSDLLNKIVKINPNKKSKPEYPNYDVAPVEGKYIINWTKRGNIESFIIYQYGYTIQKNNNKYIDEICNYIDFVVSEVNKFMIDYKKSM